MTKPNIQPLSEEDIAAYASVAAELKKLSQQDKARQTDALRSALTGTLYQAVAFDIDGTLTRDEDHELDTEMAFIISRLLLRAVPVLLVTGRGVRSTRQAVEQIITHTSLPRPHLRRLYCIILNGAELRTTDLDSPQPLNHVEQLAPSIADVNLLNQRLSSKLQEADLLNQVARIDPKEQLLRLVLSADADEKRIIQTARDVATELPL